MDYRKHQRWFGRTYDTWPSRISTGRFGVLLWWHWGRGRRSWKDHRRTQYK